MFKLKKQKIILGAIVLTLIVAAGVLSHFHLKYGIFYSPSVRQGHSELFEQASYIYLKKAFPTDFPMAEIMAKRAINYNKNNIGAYIILAQSLYGQEKLEEATKIYRTGLKIEPDNFEMNFYLANVYRDLGEFELMDKYYQKAVELQPNNVVVWANWASGYSFDRKDWAGAARIFEKALQVNPDNEKLKTLYEIAKENAGIE